MNVAIPHVKLAGLEKAICSLGVHQAGAEWDAVDGAPVKILFTVLRPAEAGEQHDPEQHLEMMRWIAKLGRDADFRNFALQAKTKKELVDLLKDPEENVRNSAEQALVGMTGLEDLAGSHEAWTRYLEDKNGR